jgi:polyisoprenoid-binding protein YceI
MFRRHLLIIAAATLISGQAYAQIARGFSADPAAAPAGEYKLDKAHTSLLARVVHLGFSKFTMRFDRVDGALTYDASDPTKSKVDITVDATSINTGLGDFDKEIANGVFGAEQNPTMHFVSTGVRKTGATSGEVTGDLTFHGVTKPVTLLATFNGTALGLTGKPRVGFSAVGAFKRSDFGATKFSQYTSDEVQLLVEAEFSK